MHISSERLSYSMVAHDPLMLFELTGLSHTDFTLLLRPFEHAFEHLMGERTLEGKPRQNRRYRSYINSPLPTPEERLFFVLHYLRQKPTQALQGRLFGLPQCKVNQWLHVLLPTLLAALHSLDVPHRIMYIDLIKRLEVVLRRKRLIFGLPVRLFVSNLRPNAFA